MKYVQWPRGAIYAKNVSAKDFEP